MRRTFCIKDTLILLTPVNVNGLDKLYICRLEKIFTIIW